MTATTQDRTVSRAVHLVMQSVSLYPSLEESLAEVSEIVAAMQEQHERDIAYVARVEEKNSALNAALIDANNRLAGASREVEHLYLGASMDLERHTSRFNTMVRLRDTLDPSAAGDLTPYTPRFVAVGD